MGEYEPTPSPAELRISDADRHQVAELLREAAGEGRIDMDELDERLEGVFRAKTYGDLVPLTADLPVAGAPGPPAVAASSSPPTAVTPGLEPSFSSTIAIMGGPTRRGAWVVGDTHTAVAFWGGADIDLREAIFTSRETVIYASAIMGGVDITVNERTHVIVDGMGIMGAFEQGTDKVPAQFDADSPVVRVKGFALMAGVTVTRKGPSRKRRKEIERERRRELGG